MFNHRKDEKSFFFWNFSNRFVESGYAVFHLFFKKTCSLDSLSKPNPNNSIYKKVQTTPTPRRCGGPEAAIRRRNTRNAITSGNDGIGCPCKALPHPTRRRAARAHRRLVGAPPAPVRRCICLLAVPYVLIRLPSHANLKFSIETSAV